MVSLQFVNLRNESLVGISIRDVDGLTSPGHKAGHACAQRHADDLIGGQVSLELLLLLVDYPQGTPIGIRQLLAVGHDVMDQQRQVQSGLAEMVGHAQRLCELRLEESHLLLLLKALQKGSSIHACMVQYHFSVGGERLPLVLPPRDPQHCEPAKGALDWHTHNGEGALTIHLRIETLIGVGMDHIAHLQAIGAVLHDPCGPAFGKPGSDSQIDKLVVQHCPYAALIGPQEPPQLLAEPLQGFRPLSQWAVGWLRGSSGYSGCRRAWGRKSIHGQRDQSHIHCQAADKLSLLRRELPMLGLAKLHGLL
mmetsp:Transcript_42521/g.76308  ORF Transcript_42521/g.76308 Transcript_42521/m.76308 type:complete len:308 (-) Transcript_42521:316-1239(-)